MRRNRKKIGKNEGKEGKERPREESFATYSSSSSPPLPIQLSINPMFGGGTISSRRDRCFLVFLIEGVRSKSFQYSIHSLFLKENGIFFILIFLIFPPSFLSQLPFQFSILNISEILWEERLENLSRSEFRVFTFSLPRIFSFFLSFSFIVKFEVRPGFFFSKSFSFSIISD